MREFESWLNEVRQTNMDTEIPMEIVNSLNEIIQKVGIETFNCFERLCFIERNTHDGPRSDPTPKEVQSVGI